MDTPVYRFERTEKQDGPHGTHVSMPRTAANPDGVTYHFAHDPEADTVDEYGETARHFFASVTDVSHMTMFLAASNAFRLVESEDDDPAASVVGTPGEGGGGASPLPVVATEDLAGLDLAALRKVFKAELGRNYSPKSTAETLIAQITAKRAEPAAQ